MKMLTISSLALKKGDKLLFERLSGLYTHCAVYIDNGFVIHFNVDPRKSLWDNMKGYFMGLAEIRVGRLIDVAGTSNVIFIGYPEPVTNNEREKLIKLALERVGERSYSLHSHNCHHLCQEITGIEEIPSDKYLIKKVILELEVGVKQNDTRTIFPKISGADLDSSESRFREINFEICHSYRSHISWTDWTNHNGLTACKKSSFNPDDILHMDSQLFGRLVDAVCPKKWQAIGLGSSNTAASFLEYQLSGGCGVSIGMCFTSVTPSILSSLQTQTLDGNYERLMRYVKSTADIDYQRLSFYTTPSISFDQNTQISDGNGMYLVVCTNTEASNLCRKEDKSYTKTPIYKTSSLSCFRRTQISEENTIPKTTQHVSPVKTNSRNEQNFQDLDILLPGIEKEVYLLFFTFASEEEMLEFLELAWTVLLICFMLICVWLKRTKTKWTFIIWGITCVLSLLLVGLAVFLSSHRLSSNQL